MNQSDLGVEDFGIGVDGFSYEPSHISDLVKEWGVGWSLAEYLNRTMQLNIVIGQKDNKGIAHPHASFAVRSPGYDGWETFDENGERIHGGRVATVTQDGDETDFSTHGDGLGMLIAVGDGSNLVRSVLGPALIGDLCIQIVDESGGFDPAWRVSDASPDHVSPLRVVRTVPDGYRETFGPIDNSCSDVAPRLTRFAVISYGAMRVIKGGVEVPNDITCYEWYGADSVYSGRAHHVAHF